MRCWRLFHATTPNLPGQGTPRGLARRGHDADGAGACEVTIFAGHRAEERAREYAEWLSGRKGETVLDTPISV
jgi:hypothetical protein